MQILIRTAQYKYANAGIKLSPFPDQLARKTELYFGSECHSQEDLFEAHHVCLFVCPQTYGFSFNEVCRKL